MARAQWPLAGAAAALATLAVAGCGSVTAAQSAQNAGAQNAASGAGAAAIRVLPAASRLCARPGAVGKVFIVRQAGLPRSPEGTPALPSNGGNAPAGQSGSVPAPVRVTTVTSAKQARTLARAVCALPRAPRGPMSCPAMFPGVFRLSFIAPGVSLPAVTIQTSGCEIVTGISPPRTAIGRQSFWNLLARLAGPAPGWPAHLPGAPVAPGAPVLPGNGTGHGCAPRSASTPPGSPVKACPGPDRPAGVNRK